MLAATRDAGLALDEGRGPAWCSFVDEGAERRRGTRIRKRREREAAAAAAWAALAAENDQLRRENARLRRARPKVPRALKQLAPYNTPGPRSTAFVSSDDESAPNVAALPELGAELEDAALLYEPGADESADVPPPPEFQLCRELSEACDTVATSSSAETPPRAATPKRSLTVTLCIGNKAKKQKTDVDAEAEFEFPENQNNAKVLSLLKELQEIGIAASRRGL